MKVVVNGCGDNDDGGGDDDCRDDDGGVDGEDDDDDDDNCVLYLSVSKRPLRVLFHLLPVKYQLQDLRKYSL